jgi:catechol 2,3-dioxygenase-like lactoylglutathione lyase family enzyme
MADAPRYAAGPNVAMKLPERHYAATLSFYRDALGLPVVEDREDGALIAFGAVRLHLDRVATQSQPDVWLQITADDTAAARAHLAAHGATLCPEVEPLPPGFDGFWIAAPSGAIHLVSATPQERPDG